MTVSDNMVNLSPDSQIIIEKLETCYDQLAELSANHTDDKATELLRVSEEASQLVDLLTNEMRADKPNGLSRDRLVNLQRKVNALIQTITQQMSGTKEKLDKVKKGQTAVKGYRPIRVGMGFTEGKFVDSKK